jgi:tellurite resistance protein TehA-like permease
MIWWLILAVVLCFSVVIGFYQFQHLDKAMHLANPGEIIPFQPAMNNPLLTKTFKSEDPEVKRLVQEYYQAFGVYCVTIPIMLVCLLNAPALKIAH